MSLPHWWPAALTHLTAADPHMAALIAQYPIGGLRTRGNHFSTLARAVVGQQISVKAADSVWNKVLVSLNQDVTPQAIQATPTEALRACGLSGQKVKYLQGISHAFIAQTIHPDQWESMDDAQVIQELTSLPGIGVWTAEMLLMFHLQRPNVLPLKDIGLLKGYAHIYGTPRGLAKLTGKPRYDKLAQHVQKQSKIWQPYSSAAVWYLWRALDPVEVQY